VEVLPDIILLDELLDGALPGWLMLGPAVLLEPLTLKGLDVLDLEEDLKILDIVGDLRVLDGLEDLNMLDLIEGLLDRAGAVALTDGLLTLGPLDIEGEEEGLEDDPLLRLLLLDPELLPRIAPNDISSAKGENARASVIRAISQVFRYLRVHILMLLSPALILARQVNSSASDPSAGQYSHIILCSKH
jgi:hypothetical protein